MKEAGKRSETRDFVHNQYEAVPNFAVEYAAQRENCRNSRKMTYRESRAPCAKYYIFGCNILLAVIGFGLVSFGVWLKCSPKFRPFLSEEYREAVKDQFWSAPTLYVSTYLIIVLGVLSILTLSFGCCGAIRESQCCLVAYFVFVVMLFCLFLGTGVWLFYRKDKVQNEVQDAMTYMVQKYFTGPDIVRQAADAIQDEFRCCGNDGCGDYSGGAPIPQDRPRSCVYCDGCGERIFRALREGYTIVAVVIGLVLLVQLGVMATSLYLCCWIRSHSEDKFLRYYSPPEPSPPVGKPAQKVPSPRPIQHFPPRHRPSPPVPTKLPHPSVYRNEAYKSS